MGRETTIATGASIYIFPAGSREYQRYGAVHTSEVHISLARYPSAESSLDSSTVDRRVCLHASEGLMLRGMDNIRLSYRGLRTTSSGMLKQQAARPPRRRDDRLIIHFVSSPELEPTDLGLSAIGLRASAADVSLGLRLLLRRCLRGREPRAEVSATRGATEAYHSHVQL